MSDFADVASALLAQVTKLVKSMSDDDVKRVASGQSKVALVSSSQRVLEGSAALTMALKVLSQMSPQELQQVEDRHARLVLLPKGARINYPLDRLRSRLRLPS